MMRVLFMQLNPAVMAVAAILAVPLNVSPAAALPAQLAESQWRLVEVQSMDSAQGTTRPSPGTTYTMELSRDGSVTMQLNCNRARGTWSAQGSAEASSGGFRFGPLAATRAFCPPPSLDTVLLAQAANIRSYLLKDGRLMLSLLADGGIVVWEPAGSWQVSGPVLLRQQPAWSAEVLGRLASDTLVDRLGCQRSQGRLWCQVQQRGGGLRGYVPADQLQPAPKR
jgi:heat shock protein HslJ